VDGVRNEALSYAFALEKAKEAGSADDIASLEAVGPPARGQYRGGFKGLMTQRDIMKKYGGYSTNKAQQNKGFVATFAKPMLQSREYTPADLLGIWLGYKKTLSAMWPRLTGYDFIHECNTFAMPYYIFQGRHDSTTPSALVEEFYAAIDAPAKDLVWFEDSGHSFAGEMEKFKRLLREKLL
jgi:pimeloyl-ACP methyl ester carboxylesterase